MRYFDEMKIIDSVKRAVRFSALALCVFSAGCSGLKTEDVQRFRTESLAEAAPQEDYRLQVGDQIDLQIYREPQLSGAFRVDSAGQIRHPLCGSFKAEGLTVSEAERHLTEVLGENYLVNPRVIISILSAQSSHVVILGEVANPGVHPVAFGESITLLQAIAEAGGFTDLASVNRVTVVRTVAGKEKSIRVRVSRLISGEEPDMKLQPDDVIMVPQIVF